MTLFNTRKTLQSIMLAGLALSFTGCAAFRASTTSVDVNENIHFSEKFDYADLRNFTEQAANELAASDFVADRSEKPVLMIAGVQNRTSEYIDTKNLTDRMRTLLFKTGKFRFINEARREDLLKEQGYQAANASPETQRLIGEQLGAEFMLSGSLTEMRQTSQKQVRLSKQKLNYYKLTLEMTDLNTGELLWMDEQELARQASQPIIGW